jgi:hypothetical protein
VGPVRAVPVLVFVAFLNVMILVLWFLAVSIAIGRTATGSSTLPYRTSRGGSDRPEERAAADDARRAAAHPLPEAAI